MPSPSMDTMCSQATTTNDRDCLSLSPGGGMLLPSSNQLEIVKGFISELTFWGDLPMTEPSEKRDDLVGDLLQRVNSSISLESRRSVQQTTVEAAKSPKITGPVWKTAVDPHSGRTYYYDAISRQTQWDKVSRRVDRYLQKLMQRCRQEPKQLSHDCH
jgi:WW domain